MLGGAEQWHQQWVDTRRSGGGAGFPIATSMGTMMMLLAAMAGTAAPRKTLFRERSSGPRALRLSRGQCAPRDQAGTLRVILCSLLP